MNQLTNRRWWEAAATRAVKTAAQTTVALVGTNAIGMTDVNWAAVGSAAALAALLSMLTSIAGLPEVDAGTAAATDPDATSELPRHLGGE